MAERDNRVKIIFDLEEDSLHGSGTESVWAEPAGEDCFRVRNIPFYTYGISLDDIVEADPVFEHHQQVEGMYHFRRVLTRGGHSTYRLVTPGTSIENPRFEP